MVNVDKYFTNDANDDAGQDCHKYIGENNCFADSLGSARAHHFHDDDEHGATKNKGGEQDVQLRRSPSRFTVTQAGELISSTVPNIRHGFDICGWTYIVEVRIFVFNRLFSFSAFFSFGTLLTFFSITFSILFVFFIFFS